MLIRIASGLKDIRDLILKDTSVPTPEAMVIHFSGPDPGL